LLRWQGEHLCLAAWHRLLETRDERGLLKWDETFFAGSVAPAKKGGTAVGEIKRGKGTKWMVLVDGKGLSMGVRLEGASSGEATLGEATVAEARAPQPRGRPLQEPRRFKSDRGYDSDPILKRFKERGSRLMVLYRKNNKRRWIVERTSA
jgi:hypothetical protein